jgi:hypothetical protein
VSLRHFVVFLLLSSCGAFAQGGLYKDKAEGKLINSNALIAIPGATIKVCTDQACASPITLYSDAALTQSLGTTTVADLNANYIFFATPGIYWCQESAVGFATSITRCQISATTGVGGGSGTVTTVSGLAPLFTVANPTTTPAFSLSQAAAHTFFGNNTGVLGTPAYFRPACADLSDASAFCNGTAYSSLTGTPTLAANTTATTHQFFSAYNSTTGAFTKAQPASADLSDVANIIFKNQANTYSGGGLQDFSAMDVLQPIHSSDPATCTAGQIEFNSVGVAMKFCSATNTWTALATGAGSMTWPSGTGIAHHTGSNTSWDTPINDTAAKTGQVPTATNGSAMAFASPGLKDGNSGAHVTTTPYVVQCDSSTALIDRNTTIVFDSGASVVTLPDHTATGCGSSMVFALINESGSTLTVNRGGSDTINLTGTVAKATAQTSFTIVDSGSATVSNGESTIWNARLVAPSSGSLSGMTVGQVAVAGSATTITSSKALNGTDANVQTGTGTFDATKIAVGDANGGVTPATALPSGITATTQSADDNSTKVATTAYVDRIKIRTITFTFGAAEGSALSSSITRYVTVPFGCTVSAYNLLADAGTFTVKFWKIASGTAIPTVSNSISTSGVSLATGTALHSTTLTDFTTTTVTPNDIVAANITAVATSKMVQVQLECDQ